MKNLIILCAGMIGATFLCLVLGLFQKNDAYVSMIFILAVFLIARFTSGYLHGMIASVLSVFAVNYAFTYPYFAFDFSMPGYPITILCLFAVSLITSTMTTKLMQQEKIQLENEKQRMRSNLLRAISHDLRTPLTSIYGAGETLYNHMDSLPESEQKKLLAGIKEESQWLIRMVENLLSVTKMEDGSGCSCLYKTQEVMEEVIAESVMKFKNRFPEFTVEVAVPEEPIMVYMDAMLIEQVLINLLENIVYHAETATKAWIQVKNEQHYIAVLIYDDGCGFTHSIKNTLKQDKHRNMGLGLDLCKTIMKAHEGSFTIKDQVPQGTCAEFRLPI